MFQRIRNLFRDHEYRMELKCSSDSDGPKQFWSRIVHRNGQVLYTSEMYTTRSKRSGTARRFAQAAKIPLINMEGR